VHVGARKFTSACLELLPTYLFHAHKRHLNMINHGGFNYSGSRLPLNARRFGAATQRQPKPGTMPPLFYFSDADLPERLPSSLLPSLPPSRPPSIHPSFLPYFLPSQSFILLKIQRFLPLLPTTYSQRIHFPSILRFSFLYDHFCLFLSFVFSSLYTVCTTTRSLTRL
jgi:hypothetical protein